MTEERKPDGWFVSLKDAKSGKISELMIARTPDAAEEWRSKGYIVRPFVYLSDEDEKPRTCENCKHSCEHKTDIDNEGYRLFQSEDSPHRYLICDAILPVPPRLKEKSRPWIVVDDWPSGRLFPLLRVPKDHYCKHWESAPCPDQP